MLKTLQGLPITPDMKSKFLSFPNKALYMNWLPVGLTSSHSLRACSKPATLSALCLSNFTSKFLLQGLGVCSYFWLESSSLTTSHPSFLCKLCSNVTCERGLPSLPHLKQKLKLNKTKQHSPLSLLHHSCLSLYPIFFTALNHTADNVSLCVC